MVNTNTYCAICGGPAHDIEPEGETWKEIDGTEYLLTSPTKIQRVKDFFKTILAESQLEEPAVAYPDGASEDALESLPGELMSSVLQCLDYESLCAIRLASRNAVKETSSIAFWKNRVLAEMPWIVDFFPGKRDTENPQIDWFKVYKALRSISQGKDQRQPLTTGGLRNRSRVWDICSQILNDYWSRKEARDE
ncbi:f-box domain-containing protein [Fusarium mexicanum]|uniref:F-box domain-containing protein n=1 Tax=Fusarium mexicanum TaxID=751941 RepID=A0A8H5JEK7_9HYPO|nr:f-box domain-containing protein [Fusarium mexicanum]